MRSVENSKWSYQKNKIKTLNLGGSDKVLKVRVTAGSGVEEKIFVVDDEAQLSCTMAWNTGEYEYEIPAKKLLSLLNKMPFDTIGSNELGEYDFELIKNNDGELSYQSVNGIEIYEEDKIIESLKGTKHEIKSGSNNGDKYDLIAEKMRDLYSNGDIGDSEYSFSSLFSLEFEDEEFGSFFIDWHYEKKLITDGDNLREEEKYEEAISVYNDYIALKFNKSLDEVFRENKLSEKGLKDLSISRTSFSWGIPVPKNNKHVIYVWLDALTNYISALNYPDKENELFKKFWPASVHLIGKDILRFHSVYWPAFLMAAKIPLPKKVYGHGWILSGDEKMSKSKGNILDPLDIIEIYGLDPLRYYLIKEVSFGNDGNISQDRLEDCINSDLANNYGNLCQRVTAFAEKNCSSSVPDNKKFNDEDLVMLNKFTDNLTAIRTEIDNQNINYYINFIVSALFEANKYFNDQEPWKKKDDKDRLNTIVYTSLEMIRKISFMLYPIIPSSIEKALKIFNLNVDAINFESIAKHDYLVSGKPINKIDILFKKIEKKND